MQLIGVSYCSPRTVSEAAPSSSRQSTAWNALIKGVQSTRSNSEALLQNNQKKRGERISKWKAYWSRLLYSDTARSPLRAGCQAINKQLNVLAPVPSPVLYVALLAKSATRALLDQRYDPRKGEMVSFFGFTRSTRSLLSVEMNQKKLDERISKWKAHWIRLLYSDSLADPSPLTPHYFHKLTPITTTYRMSVLPNTCLGYRHDPFTKSAQSGVYTLNESIVFRFTFSDGDEGDFIVSAGSTINAVRTHWQSVEDPVFPGGCRAHFIGTVTEMMPGVWGARDTKYLPGEWFSQRQAQIVRMKHRYTPIFKSVEAARDLVINGAAMPGDPSTVFNIDVNTVQLGTPEPVFKDTRFGRIFKELPSGHKIVVMREPTELLLRLESNDTLRCLTESGFCLKDTDSCLQKTCHGRAVILHPESRRGQCVDWERVMEGFALESVTLPEDERPAMNESHDSAGVMTPMILRLSTVHKLLSSEERARLKQTWDEQARGTDPFVFERLEEKLADGSQEFYDWCETRPKPGRRRY